LSKGKGGRPGTGGKTNTTPEVTTRQKAKGKAQMPPREWGKETERTRKGGSSWQQLFGNRGLRKKGEARAYEPPRRVSHPVGRKRKTIRNKRKLQPAGKALGKKTSMEKIRVHKKKGRGYWGR